MLLDLLNELCQCQGDPSLMDGDKEKRRHRQQILNRITTKLETYADSFAEALHPFSDVRIGCSKGGPKPAYVPWIAIRSWSKASKYTQGYFVDFLPVWDKSRKLYLGIIPGVGNLSGLSRQEKLRELDKRRKDACKVLVGKKTIDGHSFLSPVSLGEDVSDRSIAKDYEKALVLAEEIDFGKSDDSDLLERVCHQLKLLACVYKKVP